MKKEIVICDITKKMIEEKDIASEQQLLNLDNYFLDYYYFPIRLDNDYDYEERDIDKKITQNKVIVKQLDNVNISFGKEINDVLRKEVAKKLGVKIIPIKQEIEEDEDGQCMCCGHIFKKGELIKDGEWIGEKAQDVENIPFFDWNGKDDDGGYYSTFCNKCVEVITKKSIQKFGDHPDNFDVKEFIISNMRLNKILQKYLQKVDKILGFRKFKTSRYKIIIKERN